MTSLPVVGAVTGEPQKLSGDALDAARYRYIRDQEWSTAVGYWFMDSSEGPGNLDEAVDRARGQLTITPEEWQRRYAARLMERGDLGERQAIECAREAWSEDADADLLDGSSGLSPEDCADEEMACWENDNPGEQGTPS